MQAVHYWKMEEFTFLRQKWSKNLIDICATFPAGENDDIVDTCTQAWLRLRKGWFITHTSDYDEEDDEPKQRRITIYG